MCYIANHVNIFIYILTSTHNYNTCNEYEHLRVICYIMTCNIKMSLFSQSYTPILHVSTNVVRIELAYLSIFLETE